MGVEGWKGGWCVGDGKIKWKSCRMSNSFRVNELSQKQFVLRVCVGSYKLLKMLWKSFFTQDKWTRWELRLVWRSRNHFTSLTWIILFSFLRIFLNSFKIVKNRCEENRFLNYFIFLCVPLQRKVFLFSTKKDSTTTKKIFDEHCTRRYT